MININNLILLISLFNLIHSGSIPPGGIPIVFVPKYKTTDIEIYPKIYNVTFYALDNYMYFEFFQHNHFPSIIYENKLSKNDLLKLSPKLFYGETLNDCVRIFSELFDDKKYSLKENDNLIVTFSPKLYKINDFEISFKLREIYSKEAFRQLFQKMTLQQETNKNLLEKIGKNVLLISNGLSPILSNLLSLSPIITHFSTIKPEFVLSKIPEEYLLKFNIIIYDLNDNGFGKATNKEDIKKFLLKGGNVITTHDQWLFSGNSGMEELLNANYKAVNSIVVTKARVLQENHPVFNSYYNLTFSHLEEIVISQTHHTDINFLNSEEYQRDLVIELSDGRSGEYLMIKNYGKGKIVVWNVGHSYNLTQIEEKLFYNILAYFFNYNK